MINYFRSSKCARGGRVILEDSGFSGITTLVLNYLKTKFPSTGLIVTDLPSIQRCPQPYAAEILIISTSVILAHLVLFLVSMWSSALLLFNGTLDRTIANSYYKIQFYTDMHYSCPHMHIIIVRVWTSSGLSVDCNWFYNLHYCYAHSYWVIVTVSFAWINIKEPL